MRNLKHRKNYGRFNVCWRFPTNDNLVLLWAFSLGPKSTRCWRPTNRNSWLGHRDHALMLTALLTGLRLAEITTIRQRDLTLGIGANVRCEGKGHKERCTPLTKSTVIVLNSVDSDAGRGRCHILFPYARGDRLSADAVQHLVAKYALIARKQCPSFVTKRVSPHVLRHTTAMELLQAGVERTLIALWLGDESIETTQIYLDADLTMKERVLSKTTPIQAGVGGYRPDGDPSRVSERPLIAPCYAEPIDMLSSSTA
jgi:integrase/recombinase XerD